MGCYIIGIATLIVAFFLAIAALFILISTDNKCEKSSSNCACSCCNANDSICCSNYCCLICIDNNNYHYNEYEKKYTNNESGFGTVNEENCGIPAEIELYCENC